MSPLHGHLRMVWNQQTWTSAVSEDCIAWQSVEGRAAPHRSAAPRRRPAPPPPRNMAPKAGVHPWTWPDEQDGVKVRTLDTTLWLCCYCLPLLRIISFSAFLYFILQLYGQNITNQIFGTITISTRVTLGVFFKAFSAVLWGPSSFKLPFTSPF